MGRSMIALVLAAPLMTLVVNWAAGPGPFGFNLWIVAGLGLAVAVVIGMPLLFVALERDRDGIAALIAFGVVAGALAPLLLLLSGVVGVLLQSSTATLRFTLAHGAPIPGYGQLAWSKLLWLVARATIIGALTGALCAIVRRRPV